MLWDRMSLAQMQSDKLSTGTVKCPPMSTVTSYCGIEPRQHSAAVWNGWSIEPNPTRPCGVPLTYHLDARFREFE